MNVLGYIAEEAQLEFINQQALINLEMEFVYLDDNEDEQDFGFDDYVSAFMYVYNGKTREELIKSYTTQITRNGNILYLNCSVADMTYDDQGPYYYVVGYNRSGYEIPLRFGKLRMI